MIAFLVENPRVIVLSMALLGVCIALVKSSRDLTLAIRESKERN